jgi:hypothetical protein
MNPATTTMPVDELSQRLLFLEKAVSGLQVGDLPMANLQKSLEQNWLPDPATLFPDGAIGQGPMAFSWVYGQVGSAGTIQLGGSGKWTVAKNGAGDYTITFPQFKSVPIVLALPVASVTGFRNTVTTTSTARIVASGDTDFNFWIIGK